MSELALRLHYLQRALRRTDAELFYQRFRYEEAARRCAARLFEGESEWSPRHSADGLALVRESQAPRGVPAQESLALIDVRPWAPIP